MDVINEVPAWFLALSETSEVLYRDSSDLETVWSFPCCVLERSHVDLCSEHHGCDLQLVSESRHKLETVFDEMMEFMVMSVRLAFFLPVG